MVDKIKFICVKIINGEILESERNFLEGLSKIEIALLLMGIKEFEKQLLEEFENYKTLYEVSTDPNDLEEEDPN